MKVSRWERVQTLFHLAADLPVDERGGYVRSECEDDPSVADEVLAMLDEDARGDSLLDRDVSHLARAVLDTATTPVLPIDSFGPYRITSMLGEGGMGVVYLADRADLGSRAAIKILRDAWLSPARRERFAAEQRTLAQLNHPSIARLYDADTLPDGTPWFVMEYVEGVPLTAYCDTHASPIAARLRLFREVCEAVQHAHRHAIIHRDLKPSNILVTADGTVKLLDFGIAKQIESLDGADQTRTGLRAMTPAYAAPEQVRAGRLGIHTDVYSLGVVLYELLVGRLPFDVAGKSASEVERLIVEVEPERPSAAARRTPALPVGTSRAQSASKPQWADLDVLCLTAMHKDPVRRYGSVEALIRDVDHYLGGEPLEARPDTLGYRSAKFVRRNWREVTTAALVLAAVVGLTVFYAIRLTGARNAALAEAARTQRIQRFMLDMFRGNEDDAVGPADSLRVVTLVDRGAAQVRTLDVEPAVQAELFETLGSIYRSLGKLSPADSLLRASLEQRRRLFGGNHPSVAASLVALGELRLSQAEFDSAEALIRGGLAIAKRGAAPNDPVVAKATNSLGQVLYDRGSYAEAEKILKEAARLYTRGDTVTPGLASSLTNLANTYFYLGNYAVADSLNKRALEMDRHLYGARHAYVADVLINLGAIRQEQGQYVDAERYYREALEINTGWYGTNHPETASNLTALGRALVSQKRLADAEGVLAQALAISERVYGPVHPRVASAVNEIARVKQNQDKLDEAEAGYRRMVDIYKSVYNDKHYLISVALSNLAGVFQARKDYARAEATFREAIARYEGLLPPDHQLFGIARVRLGRALRLQGRFADGERESMAGFGILMKQATPSPTWVQWARADLALDYDSLGRAAEAVKIRADSTAMAASKQ
ncbi:MAG TPA: serine/threonine-protein kinase [Gemmatimonadaceae bacterium]|nr:serine/threonine-protein kinase [Gemmatimonadaceae bacterium]